MLSRLEHDLASREELLLQCAQDLESQIATLLAEKERGEARLARALEESQASEAKYKSLRRGLKEWERRLTERDAIVDRKEKALRELESDLRGRNQQVGRRGSINL